MILTTNETELISYLFRHYREQSSINGLAKKINVTPKGAYKILKKLEKEGIVHKQSIANANIYTLNFQDAKTEDIVKYALKSESPKHSYVKVVQEDLESLQSITDCLILFGSILTKGLQAHDIDILIIIDKNRVSQVQSTIKNIERVLPKKIHAVFQTRADMQKNLHKQDPIVIAALQQGFILWGHEIIYELIENDAS